MKIFKGILISKSEEKMIIKVERLEELPIDLLLLADPSEEIVKEYIARSNNYILIKDEKAIGVIVLLPTRPGTLEIVNIAIDPKHQGKGYAKKLLKFAINEAKNKGFKHIEIGTANSSINQLALYQKIGFRINYIDKDYFLKNYHDEIFENDIQAIDMIRLYMDL